MPEPNIITNAEAGQQQQQESAAPSAGTNASHGEGDSGLVSFKDLVPAMLASSGTSTDSQAAADSTRTPSSVSHLTHRQSSLFASGVPTVDDVMTDFEKTEESADWEASLSRLATTPATPAPDLGVPFDDGPNVGRFRVTKRVGLRVAPVLEGAEASGAAESYVKVKLVVVLLGWLGCQDKHLKKYAELYHKSLNCEVVLRHTVPAGRLLRRKQWGAVRAAEEMMTLVPLFFPEAKVVVHYFSNGGCFVHRRMLLLQSGHYRQGGGRFCCDPKPPTDEYKFPQLAGTIFDSCPVAADAEAGAKAVSAGLRSPVARLLMYMTIRFGLEVYGIAQCWRYETKYIEHIENDHTLVPSLYIFSEDDAITDPALVERIVAKRKAYFTSQGMPADAMVETWKITEPSSHVCHYARHPTEYKVRIKEFLRRQGLMP